MAARNFERKQVMNEVFYGAVQGVIVAITAIVIYIMVFYESTEESLLSHAQEYCAKQDLNEMPFFKGMITEEGMQIRITIRCEKDEINSSN
jgi:magnesium-transporting ATPase (P-type)